jgi:hypothetical protein
MRIVTTLVTLMFACMITVMAQETNPQTTQQQPTAGSGLAASTITGCLKGSASQYYVVQKDGTRQTLMAKGQDLSPYVNHEVSISGKADTSRAGSASSDAMGHRNSLFSVDTVTDQGACKQ